MACVSSTIIGICASPSCLYVKECGRPYPGAAAERKGRGEGASGRLPLDKSCEIHTQIRAQNKFYKLCTVAAL